MDALCRALIALAAIGFLVAVYVGLSGTPLFGVAAEAYSRASTNLSLLAIAIALCWRPRLAP
jgi:hypothetical protein